MHDRLEDDIDTVLHKQFAQVLAPVNEAERHLARNCIRREVFRSGRRHDRLVAEAEFPLRDVNDVAVQKRRLGNSLAVDKCAVRAPQIADLEHRAVATNFCMFFRDLA